MKNIKLVISYDGTDLLGWQKTPSGSTIEQYLEEALYRILQEKVSLDAASRTDAGVHAEGQVVRFFTSKETLCLKKLSCSLNALLPSSVAVLLAEEVPLSFHPTLDNCGKEYHYLICTGAVQLPKHRLLSWHFPYPLHVSSMRRACEMLSGTHDFSAFCNERSLLTKDPVCTLQSVHIEEFEENRLRFILRGDRFLFRMVRNLVGTLLYVGCGKVSLRDVPLVLQKKQRPLAGVTAPAKGLHLMKVFYDVMHKK